MFYIATTIVYSIHTTTTIATTTSSATTTTITTTNNNTVYICRLFRQSPLNAIWEGSGNVIALDILRGHQALPVLLTEINSVRGSDARLDNFIAQLETSVAVVAKDPLSAQSQKAARNLVDRMAVALQASILIRFAPNPVCV